MLCVEQVTSHPWVLWGLSACRDVLSLWALHCCCAAVCSTGDIVTPGFFEDYLNAENVLWRPYGGGEQITFNIAYNLLTLHFMKRFNQLSSERLAIALNEINIGEDMLVFVFQDKGGGGCRLSVSVLWSFGLGIKRLQAWTQIQAVSFSHLSLVSMCWTWCLVLQMVHKQKEKNSSGGEVGENGGYFIVPLRIFLPSGKFKSSFCEDSLQWQLGYTAYYLLSFFFSFFFFNWICQSSVSLVAWVLFAKGHEVAADPVTTAPELWTYTKALTWSHHDSVAAGFPGKIMTQICFVLFRYQRANLNGDNAVCKMRPMKTEFR